MRPRPLARLFAVSLLGLALVSVASSPGPRANAQGASSDSLESVPGARELFARLALDDASGLEAIVYATLDRTQGLPFDTAPYRVDATSRGRLVRYALPIVKRIVESPVYREAYARARARRIDERMPRPTRTRAEAAPGAAERAEAEAARRRQELETEVPEDPNALVAVRLREFLALTEAMPWRARLVPNGRGRMVFVDPALEAKPADFKLCFRAGRASVDAARAFARRWLAELERPARAH